MGDIRNANPDDLDVLADKLWTSGDGGAYGDLAAYFDRARGLDVSGQMASLSPLLEWLRDAAQQLRKGARILRGDSAEYVDPLAYDPTDQDSDAQGTWEFEVSDQLYADEFIQLASKDELSANDISRLQGLIDHADEQPDFAAYLVDSISMEEFLTLFQDVENAAADMDDTARADAEALQTSMGNVLAAAFWVPGDLRPGTDKYRTWIDTTPQGQRYAERLDAFNLAGKQRIGSGEESSLGFDVALDALELAEIPLDSQFFTQTMTHLGEPFAAEGDPSVIWPVSVPERLLTLAAGDSPQEVNDWWASLDEATRDSLTTLCPTGIGAMDGLPTVARDRANRIVLESEYERLSAELERLRAQEPEERSSVWGAQCDILENELAGMEAIRNRLDHTGDPPAFLLGINTEGDGQYIVANGNPDTADHTAVFVPGTTSDLAGAAGGIRTMNDLWNEANRQAQGESVSTITWLGYDAPDGAIPFVDGEGLIPEASDEHWAVDGAPALNAFTEGLRASHEGVEPSHTTLIGHSYGSTVIGAASLEGDLNADDVLVAGSPGMLVDEASDLGVGSSHVWSMAAGYWEDKVPWIGAAFLGGGGILDPDVEFNRWGIPSFEFDVLPQVPSMESFGANIMANDSSGHSDYFDSDSESLRNQAQVVLGRYDRVVLE